MGNVIRSESRAITAPDRPCVHCPTNCARRFIYSSLFQSALVRVTQGKPEAARVFTSVANDRQRFRARAMNLRIPLPMHFTLEMHCSPQFVSSELR